METRTKEVVKSDSFYKDIQEIFEYGESTFGEKTALSFFNDIVDHTKKLNHQYLLHPECRYLETRTKKYRNIILGAYLIIYRITPNRIEVLRALHSSRTPKTIKNSRSIKIN